MLKFYRWLFRYAERQCKKYQGGADVKCPQCQLWYSATGGKLRDMDAGYEVDCGQCHEKTVWITNIYPFPVRSEDFHKIEIEKTRPYDAKSHSEMYP